MGIVEKNRAMEPDSLYGQGQEAHTNSRSGWAGVDTPGFISEAGMPVMTVN
jgi:hypothetical protein